MKEQTRGTSEIVKTSLRVVILTYNETLHIKRVIESVKDIATEVIVVDSYSSDDTVEIANSLGAIVLQNHFINQAQQLKWFMSLDKFRSEWTLRLDADEYLTPELKNEIKERIADLPEDTSGVIFKRRVVFMGKWIKYGGYYPVRLLRLWRTSHAAVEQKRMDEHIYLLKGKAIEFENDIIDENLNNLTWWTNKHNNYASREANEVLMNEYEMQDNEKLSGGINQQKQASTKRWFKNNFYMKLPLFHRAFLYFIYRYFLKLGFLDGRRGFVFHFLQALWYRFLVDAKIFEIRRIARKDGKSIKEIIESKYDN